MEESVINITSEKPQSKTRVVEVRKTVAYYVTQPVVRLLAKTSITPNTITWLGFMLSAGAAALIITGHLFAASFTVLAAGLFDLLDGALARHTNQATRFGAILDSALDRLAEAIVLVGILALYAINQSTVGILLAGIALPSSMLVSYLRARAEATGLECKVGLFTRGERVIVLALGLLLSQIDYALFTALSIIVSFSLFTAGQRLLYIWHQTKTN